LGKQILRISTPTKTKEYLNFSGSGTTEVNQPTTKQTRSMKFLTNLFFIIFVSFLANSFAFLSPQPYQSVQRRLKNKSIVYVERLGGFGQDLVEKVDKALINSSSSKEISEQDVKDLLTELNLTIRVVENDLRELKYYENALSSLLQGKKMNFGDDNTEEAQTLKDTLEAIARAFSTGEKNDFPALSMAVGFSGDLYRKK
jgi:hypothetical protein